MSADGSNSPCCDQICRDFFIDRDEFAKRRQRGPESHPNIAKCLKWMQEFDKDLQEHLSRVGNVQKEIQRHCKEHMLEIEVYKHSTGMLGAPKHLQDEMWALMSKWGEMRAIDHIALKKS